MILLEEVGVRFVTLWVTILGKRPFHTIIVLVVINSRRRWITLGTLAPRPEAPMQSSHLFFGEAFVFPVPNGGHMVHSSVIQIFILLQFSIQPIEPFLSMVSFNFMGLTCNMVRGELMKSHLHRVLDFVDLFCQRLDPLLAPFDNAILSLIIRDVLSGMHAIHIVECSPAVFFTCFRQKDVLSLIFASRLCSAVWALDTSAKHRSTASYGERGPELDEAEADAAIVPRKQSTASFWLRV